MKQLVLIELKFLGIMLFGPVMTAIMALIAQGGHC